MMAILTFIVEYLLFSFVSNTILLTLLVFITLLIANHMLLEITLRYKACLMLTSLLLVLWGGMTYMLMINKDIGGLHYSWLYWLTTLLNFIVPYVYSFIRQYMDRGPRFPDYNKFFIGMTIIFFIPFTVIFVYLNYINPNFFTIYQPKDYTFIPFYTTAVYIENILNHTIKGSTFFVYIGLYTLLFLPLGYHARLITRDFTFTIRTLVFIVICAITEVIKIPFLSTFNMDNILYSIIGMLIGGGLFAYVDFKHYEKKDVSYLHKPSFNFTYRY